MRFSTLTLAALACAAATPAIAQDTAPPKPVSVSGGITFTTDYRFRGLTQSGASPAIQGTLNVNTAAGFYVGTWASSIHGDVNGDTPALRGYGKAEVDLYGGYTKTLKNGLGVDAGLLYYYYPDAVSGQDTDFFEPYASVSYAFGPIGTKVGVNYAWSGQDGLDFTGGKDDDLYVYGEASVAVPKTPITLKGHLGRTGGSLGLVNLNPRDDTYYDWSVTAEAVGGPLKVGISYVDTDVTHAYVRSLQGPFDTRLGRGPAVLGYLGVSF